MATLITLPSCALRLLEHLYPTVDWTRVGFFSGLPWYTSLANSFVSVPTTAITLPDPLTSGAFRLYLGDNTDFCDPAQLKVLVHEAYHIHQFMSVGGGYGPGFVRPGFIAYFICLFHHGYEENPFETEAYAQETAFWHHYANPGGDKICDCSTGEPVFNPLGLDWLDQSPIPLVIKEPGAPRCESWWAPLLASLLVALLAAVAILAHLFDRANCTLIRQSRGSCSAWGRQIRQVCRQFSQTLITTCAEWGEDQRQECQARADQGQNQCIEWGTNATSSCCTWWPCSWGCRALVWIVTSVCRASVWVSNWVCILWTWVVVLVCRLYATVILLTCLVWSYVLQVWCLVWTFTVRLVLFCW
jgi:hypothetical protein